MTPAARLSAATEALDDIERRRRPAAQALKDWGLSHRFAGSGDRAAIAGLVYDTLRRKTSSAWIMGADTQRAVTFGDERVEEAAALASRAPLDLRVNTLKATREQALDALSEFKPQPTR